MGMHRGPFDSDLVNREGRNAIFLFSRCEANGSIVWRTGEQVASPQGRSIEVTLACGRQSHGDTAGDMCCHDVDAQLKRRN